ncbi:unnamed protein product [Adineta steineri]|uniref:PARP catalytic domain-containing protein n=1 Tax=Adineta steineri TaxID=433720 RepID=A0A818ZZX9_9BILA|nr:unnamed protein product [Adineta steineri]CAF3776290.1 unnamed protein product [Adineta steineri]
MNEEKADATITVGFILDWVGSLVPTFMGIIIGFVLLIVALKILCSLGSNDKNKVRTADDSSVTLACSKFLLCSRPMNRFVALNCNCPCYIPRPRLRFTVRLVFLLFSILLRILAIILYATSKVDESTRPQERWGLLSPNEATTYVGFHRTTAESAVAIAHSDFRQSMKGSQMLGFGVYFARSIARTEGKARFAGALICAEIRMGRVKEVTFDQLYTVRNSNAWWTDYDTVYYNHKEDDRDEFCVKDPAQILKWVIVVDEAHDTKVNQYGLDAEFEDTFCHCI